MFKLQIQEAFIGVGGLSDALCDELMDHTYVQDLERSFATRPRQIDVPYHIDISELVGKVQLLISVSSEFNSVSIVAADEEDNQVELHNVKIDSVVSPEVMADAVDVLERHKKGSGGSALLFIALDQARSQSHTKITKIITDHFNNALPGLLLDHKNEERCLAGVIRAVKHAQQYRMSA